MARRDNGTLIMTSHDPYMLEQYCTRGAVLYSGALIFFDTVAEACNVHHTLQMKMNMVDPVVLNPQSIISEGKVGDELKKTATITNSFDREISITEISSNSPVVKVTSDKMVLSAGDAASLSINIKIYEDSAINAAIIIKTSEGEFQIPILVDVKAK